MLRLSLTTVPQHAVPSAQHTTTQEILANLNFNDRDAVREAHQRLTQAPALIAFCDEACDGRASEDVRGAVAALRLYKCTDQRNKTTRWIATGREDARMMLAERLSPAGKAALLQTLDATVGGNGFSDYLASSDRFLMAGWACLAQADAHRASKDLESAAKIYLKAAHAFKMAGRQASAAEAYLRAAESSAGEPAAKNYRDSADSLMEAGQPLAAAYRYLKAVHIYLEVGKPVLAEQAAQLASVIFEAQGQLKQAAAALALTSGIMGFPYGQAEPPEKTIAKPESLNTHLYEKPNANSTSTTPTSAEIDINNVRCVDKAKQADNIGLFLSKTDVNGKKVLDVGSGLGFNSAAMSNLGGDVYSVDPDTDATTSALALGNTTPEKLRPTTVEDVVAEFRDSVDLATIFYFRIPFDTLDSVFKALSEVLKKDGKVVITTEDDALKKYIVEHGERYFAGVSAQPRGSKTGIRSLDDPLHMHFGGLWQITLKQPIKPSSL